MPTGPRAGGPLPGRAGRQGHDAHGYHRGLFTSPVTPADRFEIVMGALLTQNTAWANVEPALEKLRKAGIRLPRHVLSCPTDRLAQLVRSSGYFNQKAMKLKVAAQFFSMPGRLSGAPPPQRAELLALRGIGPETADSILLYAFHVPSFVVDAYTRRILQRLGVLEGHERYEDVQELFHRSLRTNERRCNEFHALIVAHGKNRCAPQPDLRRLPREALRAGGQDAKPRNTALT